MKDALDNLPSVGQMFKLVVILLLAVIVVALVVAIIKMLVPLAILAALIVGGVYLFKKLQTNGAVS
jgi:hypothetical protein